MGWRETMGGTDSGMNALTQYPQNTQNPGRALAPVPESGGFGDIGGFGYGIETEKPTAPRTRAGLRLALSEAREGLPVTLAELVEAFGTEAEADWLEGYGPHCRLEFLRAFAATLAARLERERVAEPEPDPAPEPTPGPLHGLPLLREDWPFIERRTQGRRDRESLLVEYARRWKEAAEAEPLESRKANAGRFAANAWLREVGA